MQKNKILKYIIVILVLVVGLQGYYLHSANKTKQAQGSVENQNSTKMIKPLYKDDFSNTFIQNQFKQMQKMQQEMEKTFNSMNSRFAIMPDFDKYFGGSTISPSVNMKKFKDRYELEVNIPGSDKNNINVSAKDGMLKIEAKTESKKDEKDPKYIKREMFSSSFLRELSLPKDAKSDKLTTSYKNGVLKNI